MYIGLSVREEELPDGQHDIESFMGSLPQKG